MSCKEPFWWAELAQYVADGEPLNEAYAALRAHLPACAACRQRLAWLRLVEQTLRAWPQARPDPAMAARIMAQLPPLPAGGAVWEALPWIVWVPALALGLGLALAMLALPPQMTHDLGLSLAEWPQALKAYDLVSQQAALDRDLFWTLWSGLFVAVGGIGLTVALNAWSERCSREAAHLRLAVSEAAHRLSRLAQRPS